MYTPSRLCSNSNSHDCYIEIKLMATLSGAVVTTTAMFYAGSLSTTYATITYQYSDKATRWRTEIVVNYT